MCSSGQPEHEKTGKESTSEGGEKRKAKRGRSEIGDEEGGESDSGDRRGERGKMAAAVCVQRRMTKDGGGLTREKENTNEYEICVVVRV